MKAARHLPEDQVRAYAKQFTVTDKETGEDRDGHADRPLPGQHRRGRARTFA